MIINQHLILASIVSIIVLLSRLAIHASDYTIGDLREIINFIEKIEFDETPSPTYANAEIIALIATRSFEDRKLHEYILARKSDERSFEEKECDLSPLLTSNFALKYVQLYPNYLNHDDGIFYNDNILYGGRILNKGNYKRILEITKINKFLYKPVILASGKIQLLNDTKSALIKIKPEIKVAAYQNAKNKFDNPITSRLPIKPLITKLHPQVALHNDNNKISGSTNTSTDRKPDYVLPAAVKYAFAHDPKHAIVKIGQREKPLSIQENEEFKESIEKGIINETLIKLPVPKDYVPLFIDVNLPWESDKFLNEYKKYMLTPSQLITVDSILVRNAFLNSNCTAKQGIQAIETCIEHYTLLYEHAIDKNQKRLAFKELELTRRVLEYRKKNLDFFIGQEEDPFVKYELYQLQYINENLKQTQNYAMYEVMQTSVSEAFGMPIKEAKERHILNHKHIPNPEQLL